MTKKSWTIDVQENEDGEMFIQFPDELLLTAGWQEGDNLIWNDNQDGSFTLTKKEETEWVLVECVSTFRQRYMVEMPKGKSEWALDTVTMEEAKEFSQEHLGEQIVSHRIVTKEEALALCDDDNDYATSWDEEQKMKNYFTTWKEQKQND